MAKRRAKRVLLVGWDSADWNLINPLVEAGRMPVLQRLIEGGVSGRISTLLPILSPILWNSIATGKRADKHGILGFIEPVPDGRGVRPVSSSSRQAKAIWNILSQNELRACVVGWYASHPAEPISGCVLSDRFSTTVGPRAEKFPLDVSAVHPPDLLELAQALRVHPGTLTAEQLLPFFPDALPEGKDLRLGVAANILAQCASVQNAATYFAEDEEWDLLAVYYDAIDHFGHAFMEFHPPAMAHVSETDAKIFGQVVNGIYQFHDMMLGRLLDLAGSETTVMLVSDHGFFSDQMRPQPASGTKQAPAGMLDPVAWHRPQGIFVAAGTGIKRDELVHGVSLLDITPTILVLLGLPVAEDMDGRVLEQTFTEPGEISRVASYEPADPRDGVRRDDDEQEKDPWAARAALEQLAALGYISLPEDGNPAEAVEEALWERQFNLAQVYHGSNRPADALPLLRELLQKRDLPVIRVRLAVCLLALNQPEEAEAVIQPILKEHPELRMAVLVLAQSKLQRGDLQAALDLLVTVEEHEARLPYFHLIIGQIYLRKKMWTEAETSFRRALASDDDNPAAHDGLGVVLRKEGKLEDAIFEHMRAASLMHDRAQTHVNLGLALAAAQQIDWAIRAFSVATELAPEQPFPHRCLAQLYRHMKKDHDKARAHIQQAWQLRSRLRGQRPAFVAGV